MRLWIYIDNECHLRYTRIGSGNVIVEHNPAEFAVCSDFQRSLPELRAPEMVNECPS